MMCKKISLEKCKYYFDFDLLGNLYWKNIAEKCYSISIGSLAGHYHKKTGYYVVHLEGKLYKVHRILYQLYHNIELDDKLIDHDDENPKNNSFENLRPCNNSENMCNKKAHKNNLSTGLKNIYIRTYKTGKYEYYNIKIIKNKKIVFSKLFPITTPIEEVIRIRDEQLKIHHGEFMNKG